MIIESAYIWMAFGAAFLLCILVCYITERKQKNMKIKTLDCLREVLLNEKSALSMKITELEAENATLTSTKNLFENRLKKTCQLVNSQRTKIEEYKQALTKYGYDFKSYKVSRMEPKKQ